MPYIKSFLKLHLFQIHHTWLGHHNFFSTIYNLGTHSSQTSDLRNKLPPSSSSPWHQEVITQVLPRWKVKRQTAHCWALWFGWWGNSYRHEFSLWLLVDYKHSAPEGILDSGRSRLVHRPVPGQSCLRQRNLLHLHSQNGPTVCHSQTSRPLASGKRPLSIQDNCVILLSVCMILVLSKEMTHSSHRQSGYPASGNTRHSHSRNPVPHNHFGCWWKLKQIHVSW